MGGQRQYAVLGPLASGSENRAFLGCEVIEGVPHPDLPVVVVWLPDEVTHDPKQVARLQRETAFVTQLKHPNIIRVHGLECFEEGWARVVAFVDGEPLKQVLERMHQVEREIDPLVAARIITDVCEGVHFAHEEGQSKYAGRPIVHGGIRTDTVLITFHGVTMVTGYGASVLAPPNAAQQLDKFVYLAPEQIIGGKATASPSTDVYSIGALLYELLIGHAPFADAPDIERAVLTIEPAPIEDDGLRGRLGSIARIALSKRGSDRFETVQHLKEAILSALAGEKLPFHTEVAMLVNELIPASSPERTARTDLLESALDVDSVTVLSRPSQPPEGMDSALFEAARPGLISHVTAARDPSEAPPREERTTVDARLPLEFMEEAVSQPPMREARPREEVTVVDAARGLDDGNAGWRRNAEPSVYPRAAVYDEETEAEFARSPAHMLEPPPGQSHEDARRAFENATTGEAIMPPPSLAARPSVQTVESGAPMASRGAAFPMSAPMSPAMPGALPSMPGALPSMPAFVPTPMPRSPQGGAGSASTRPADPGRSAAQFPGGAIPQAVPYMSQPAVPAQSVASQPVRKPQNDLAMPAAVPRSPMREESGITAFDRKVGDSSRSVLIAVVAGAAVLLAGVFYFAQPPPEVQQEAQEETRHALPKDMVKAMLSQPSKEAPSEKPAEAQQEPAQAGSDQNAAAGDTGATAPEAPKERFGRLTINTEPPVDVYDGNDMLGRTPFTAKLSIGPHKLRFTDKKTGLNTYREYKVHAGEQKDDVSFGTSKLVVEAPDGASILLNSRVIGKAPITPVTIYEGKYHLKVTMDGKSWADWFDAPAGRTINYKVTLHE
jgi:serine/threonine-protein kinase